VEDLGAGGIVGGRYEGPMTIALVALLMRGLRSIERDEAAPEP
jgi:hypothetical protein